MTHVSTRRTATGQASWYRTMITMWHALRHEQRMRRDYRRLSTLPDELLDDMGLTRSDIRAAEAALRKRRRIWGIG